MEHIIVPAPPFVQMERIYSMTATIKTFKGRRNVVTHLFRADTDTAELDELSPLGLVGKPDEETPEGADTPEGAENALRSVLEAFTADEGNALLAYLEKRYAAHITEVRVSPLELPVPLGSAPLASVPEGRTIGFIRFDAAPDYPLPFSVRGFYDLDAHEPLVSEDE